MWKDSKNLRHYKKNLKQKDSTHTFLIPFLLVDGGYGKWSTWSTCSKTCKEGKQSRTRECNSPVPQYGGKHCQGKPSETVTCNENVPCPSKKMKTYCWSYYWSQILSLAETNHLLQKSTNAIAACKSSFKYYISRVIL